MRRWLLAVAFAAVSWLGTTAGVAAQTRADTAAVLLHAAEQLRVQGNADAARALLDMIARSYAGTPAAAEVERMLAMVQRMPETERPGRTELMVWGTLYGAWLGVAVPLMFDTEEPAAYGIGLLLGAPAGFFLARGFADTRASPLTKGQARAITFGGTFGTWQGFGWTEVLGLGADESCVSEFECFEGDPSPETRVAAGVIGGLVGIAVGSMLAAKPITSGTATAVSHGGLWGTWFGAATALLLDMEGDNEVLTSALIAGDVSLAALGVMAPKWQLSESRARLISIAGVIGALGGAGLLLIVQPDDESVQVAFPLFGSIAGLAIGAHTTRNHDRRTDEDGGERGALLNLDRGRWSLDAPQPALQFVRVERERRAAVYVPLLKAKF
jgi:hypothetical protein